MSFNNYNIYLRIANHEYWIRWTVLFFIIIITLLKVIISKKELFKVQLTVNFKDLISNNILQLVLYLSTTIIFFSRKQLGKEDSILHSIAQIFNNWESVIAAGILFALLYGIKFKNSATYFSLYMKFLSYIEIVFLLTYFIIDEINMTRAFCWFGFTCFGIIYVALSIIKLESSNKSITSNNLLNPIDKYEHLYKARKYQANTIISKIKSNCGGYTICVSGQWGTGKTSLINGIIDKIGEKHNYFIRINSMELDSLESLINYFFKKIEEILKQNNIYVGLSSEYRELIKSLSGTLISDGISNIVNNLIPNNDTDYRDNINRIDRILSESLNENSRIITVIDDIDRCSPEKAKQFLYFMKEIATLNRCVTLFLLDKNKLEKLCELEKDFLDKFFNYTGYLVDIESNHILNHSDLYFNNDSSKDSNKAIRHKIEKTIAKYDEKLIELQDDNNKFYPDEEKKSRIKDINECRRLFKSDTSNPRRINKAIDKFNSDRNELINYRNSKSEEEKNEIDVFLNKIDYENQLALLAIIYGLYNDEYQYICNKGIDDYILYIEERTSDKSNNLEHNLGALLLNEEWGFSIYRDHKKDEILSFINCIMNDISELVTISNPYNSFEELHVSFIKREYIPDDIHIFDLFLEICKAHHVNQEEKENLIKLLFNLVYKEDNTFIDRAFDIFIDSKSASIIAKELNMLNIFYEVLCEEESNLLEPINIHTLFKHFSGLYLREKLMFFANYFYPLTPIKQLNSSSWEIATLVDWNKNCIEVINSFCAISRRNLNIGSNNEFDPIDNLTDIVVYADSRFIELDMSNFYDVKYLKDNALKALKEIKSMIDIVNFLERKCEITNQYCFKINTLTSDNLSDNIEELYEVSLINSKKIESEDIRKILQFCVFNTVKMKKECYKKLEIVISNWHESNAPAIIGVWRAYLIFIKTNLIESLNDSDNEEDSLNNSEYLSAF